MIGSAQDTDDVTEDKQKEGIMGMKLYCTFDYTSGWLQFLNPSEKCAGNDLLFIFAMPYCCINNSRGI